MTRYAVTEEYGETGVTYIGLNVFAAILKVIIALLEYDTSKVTIRKQGRTSEIKQRIRLKAV